MQKKKKAAKVLYTSNIRYCERRRYKASIACLSLQARPGAPRGSHRAPTGLQTPGPAPPGRYPGARRTDAHQSGGETGEEGLKPEPVSGERPKVRFNGLENLLTKTFTIH
jgi:hypothetical protein